MIDRNVVGIYLNQVDFHALDKNQFQLTDIKPTDKQKFSVMEIKKKN